MLIGRSREQQALAGILRGLRAGHSAVTVVKGEAGIGKTALLDWLAETVGDVQVIRTTAVQQETEFSFGGLHQVLRPLLPRTGSLPAPQRRALQVALALDSGPPPDRFLVYLSALSLITSAALDRPLLFVVDDAQWLDQQSMEALAFIARRVLADPVALVFGLRAEEVSTGLDDLPVLALRGLSPESAHELLLSIVSAHRHLDYAMTRRIVAEAGGNPLAIEELAAELIDGSLTAAPLTPLPLTSRLESRFLRLVRELPPESQTLLLVAACEPTGEPRAVLEAARRLGAPAEAADAAAAAHLITVFPQVVFRHPLVRSAVYGGAAPAERRRAHLALAAAWDGPEGGDLQAWHRGAAATGPDETVASELEASAGRARSRGGHATEASFLSRAADLTPDAGARGARLLAAAGAAAAAGSASRSRALLAQAQAVIGDGDLRPYGRWLHGLFLVDDGNYYQGAAELSAAAQALSATDPAQARLIFLDAIAAGVIGGGRTSQTLLPGMGRAALATRPAAGAPITMADLLLDGIATRLACGYDQAAPVLARAIRAWQPITSPQAALWFMLGHFAALDLWDFAALREWIRLGEQHARSAGLPLILRTVLLNKINLAISAGRLAEAETASAESRELSSVIGVPEFFSALSVVEIYGIQGLTAQASAAARMLEDAAQANGFDAGLCGARFSLIRLNLGLCDYEQAVSLGLDLIEHLGFGVTALVPPDMVEAAVRTGRRELAERIAGVVSARAKVSGALWGLGLDARCQALTAPDRAAEEHYLESIRLLGASGARLDEVRSMLLYGEWLRRQNRRADARAQLGPAYEAFTGMGARAFAGRARGELAAAGQRLPKAPARDARDAPVLTAQETRVTELAVQGDTKAEMAAKLYISANTVDYHLRRIYQKFGVQSRRELTRAYHNLRGTGE